MAEQNGKRVDGQVRDGRDRVDGVMHEDAPLREQQQQMNGKDDERLDIVS